MFSWYELEAYEILDGRATVNALRAVALMVDLLQPHGLWYRYEVKTSDVYNMKAYLREYRSEMATKKTKTKSNGNRASGTGSFESPIRWLNINLTDDDSAFLGELDVTLDVLAAQFVGLGAEGYDVSLKRRGDSNECMATAVCDDPFIEGGRVGISAWSDNFPDALAALLYKLSDKLADGIPAPQERSSRRFR